MTAILLEFQQVIWRERQRDSGNTVHFQENCISCNALNANTASCQFHVISLTPIGVTTVQKVGGRSEARRAEARSPKGWERGVGFLGRGQWAPSHQLGSLGEHCKLPQRGLGQSPEKNWILVYFGTKFCRFHFLSGQILGGRITLASPALWFLGRRVPPPVFTPMIITYGIILFNTTRFWFSVIQLQALESIVQSKGDC